MQSSIACAHRECPHALNGIRLVRLKSTLFRSGSSPHASQSAALQSHSAAIQHRRECYKSTQCCNSIQSRMLHLKIIESATIQRNRDYNQKVRLMQLSSGFLCSGSSSHVGREFVWYSRNQLELNIETQRFLQILHPGPTTSTQIQNHIKRPYTKMVPKMKAKTGSKIIVEFNV